MERIFRSIFVVVANNAKELSLCHKLEFSNFYIFAILWWKPLIFQIWINWSNRIYTLKYVGSKRSGCKDIGVENHLEYYCNL